MNRFLYILYFIGIGLWQYPLLHGGFTTVRNRMVIRRDLRKLTDNVNLRHYGSLSRHVQQIIGGTEVEKWIPSAEAFYLISAVSSISAIFITSFLGSWTMALFSGIFIAALPYTLLQTRLHERRVARSREGDILIQELLNNYKIHDFNMKEAVEVTACTIEGAPHAKRLLYAVSKGFQTAATKSEVEHLLSGFRYSIDTAWGNVLATNIFFSFMYGIRVDTALEDLLCAMIRSREVVEHEKRENNEGRMILRYLAPISYLLSIVAACRYFGFTLQKFIRHQLGTPLGIQWFIVIVMLYIVSVMFNGFLSKEKMDI